MDEACKNALGDAQQDFIDNISDLFEILLHLRSVGIVRDTDAADIQVFIFINNFNRNNCGYEGGAEIPGVP